MAGRHKVAPSLVKGDITQNSRITASTSPTRSTTEEPLIADSTAATTTTTTIDTGGVPLQSNTDKATLDVAASLPSSALNTTTTTTSAATTTISTTTTVSQDPTDEICAHSSIPRSQDVDILSSYPYTVASPPPSVVTSRLRSVILTLPASNFNSVTLPSSHSSTTPLPSTRSPGQSGAVTDALTSRSAVRFAATQLKLLQEQLESRSSSIVVVDRTPRQESHDHNELFSKYNPLQEKALASDNHSDSREQPKEASFLPLREQLAMLNMPVYKRPATATVQSKSSKRLVRQLILSADKQTTNSKSSTTGTITDTDTGGDDTLTSTQTLPPENNGETDKDSRRNPRPSSAIIRSTARSPGALGEEATSAQRADAFPKRQWPRKPLIVTRILPNE